MIFADAASGRLPAGGLLTHYSPALRDPQAYIDNAKALFPTPSPVTTASGLGSEFLHHIRHTLTEARKTWTENQATTFSAISAALVFTATWVFKLPIPNLRLR